MNGLHLLAERLSPPLEALAHDAEAGVGPARIESRKVAPMARTRPETSCFGLLYRYFEFEGVMPISFSCLRG